MKRIHGFNAYAALAIASALLLSGCSDSSSTTEQEAVTSAAAVESLPVITDEPDVLTGEQEEELAQRISELEQEYSSPVTKIYIVDDSSTTNFAADVDQKLAEQEPEFQEHGVIVGINIGSKSAYIARGSSAGQNLTNDEASYIVNRAILPYVTAEDYDSSMAHALDGVYQLSHNNTTADSSTSNPSSSPSASN